MTALAIAAIHAETLPSALLLPRLVQVCVADLGSVIMCVYNQCRPLRAAPVPRAFPRQAACVSFHGKQMLSWHTWHEKQFIKMVNDCMFEL